MADLYLETGARIEIPRGAPDYPEGLLDLPDPPARLYVQGEPAALKPGLAIIGARRATPYGLACASRFAEIAAGMGVTVISGGAIGCDQAAHQGALAAGGKTVVVLGCGANVVYPKRGRALFESIAAGRGALVSEQPWDTPPLKWCFRNRNRIIATLARAVLIVEAGLPSGTFSTADSALEASRDVLVVPGSIFSRESRGSNKLLSEGAIPIVDDESFASAINQVFNDGAGLLLECGEMLPPLPCEVSERQRRVLSIVAAQPTAPEDLAAALGCSVIEAVRDISYLEAHAVLARYPDGSFGLNPRMR
ncbi:MAG: DNA-processing protein DprA [Coriobacteriales bacterium]|jgi:DNA processing protein